MSHKQGESSNCYMDGIRVKISEKYKPPPKITLAMSYSQGLTLNRQLQDNMTTYYFEINSCVKQKMMEWKTARSAIATERKIKLERLEIEEKMKKRELEELQALEAEAQKTTGVADKDNSLLIPTQSDILTPIPLAPQKYVQTIDDASPINISDFDPDTSSPFDNLELKTINDLEELKLVLENDDTRQCLQGNEKKNNYALPNNQIYESSHNSYYNMSASLPSSIQNQYEMSNTHYTSAATSTANTNGYTPYYGNSTDLYSYYNGSGYSKTLNNMPTNTNHTEHDYTKDVEYSQAYNMVPDILKALQNQLHLNMQQDQSRSADTKMLPSASVVQVHKSKQALVVDNYLSTEEDELENPYHSLGKNAQCICDAIAVMGFPLARVARVYKKIGDDEKKIIDFLLCQSQLMDLGFSEEKVTSALSESDNNRDKALELLIS